MAAVHFQAKGRPVPKQSFRKSSYGDFQDPRVVAWQTVVGWAAKEAMAGRPPFTGPVRVHMNFVLADRRRVDCENLAKGVNDGMNKIVFKDDCQIQELHILKHINRADVGVYVDVEELEPRRMD